MTQTNMETDASWLASLELRSSTMIVKLTVEAGVNLQQWVNRRATTAASLRGPRVDFAWISRGMLRFGSRTREHRVEGTLARCSRDASDPLGVTSGQRSRHSAGSWLLGRFCALARNFRNALIRQARIYVGDKGSRWFARNRRE